MKTGEVLETYHYTLVSNEEALDEDGQAIGIFPYNITKVSGTELLKDN
jgi:hypothetical protein